MLYPEEGAVARRLVLASIKAAFPASCVTVSVFANVPVRTVIIAERALVTVFSDTSTVNVPMPVPSAGLICSHAASLLAVHVLLLVTPMS